MQHPKADILSDYLSGRMTEAHSRGCERHLLECDSCREQVAFLIHAITEDPSAEEDAVLGRVESRTGGPPADVSRYLANLRDRPRPWAIPIPKLALGSVSLVLLVTVIGTFLVRWGSGTISKPAFAERPFEGRLSGQQYSAFTHLRSGSAPGDKETGKDRLTRLNSSSQELGRFYLEHDDLAKAASELEDARNKNANSPEICNDLGVAYMESGADQSMNKAIEQFQRALQLSPHFTPALFNLALAYERSGHFTEAEQHLKLYLHVDSDSPWAQEVKAKLESLQH